MEAGPFAQGEIKAVNLHDAQAGCFYLNDDSIVFKVNMQNPYDPGHPSPALIPTVGEKAFLITPIPGQPAQQVAIQYPNRELEVTLGTMVGNEDPKHGDLGVGKQGEFVFSVMLDSNNGRRIVAFKDGGEVRGTSTTSYIWFRTWKLEAVGAEKDRLVVVDRLSPPKRLTTPLTPHA